MLDRLRYAIAAAAFVLIVGGIAAENGWLPDSVPVPVIDGKSISADGDYALVLIDESQRDSATDQQWQALNSAKVTRWCDSQGVDFRRFDVRDDLSMVEDVWREMREHASGDLPELLIASGGRLVVRDVPGSADELISEIRSRVE
jgi:hypothetical protein